MQLDVPVHRLSHTDLVMYQCGTQNCEPGHDYGPAVRDHYLIHYVHSGRGTFQVNEKTYPLRQGQGFLIVPNAVTYYQADFEDPWTYSWVGFHGLKAESCLKAAGLTPDSPIFTYTEDDYITRCFDDMLETKKLQKGREIRLLGLLYLFLSQLMESNGMRKIPDEEANKAESYVRSAMEYVAMNYSRSTSVSDIAHFVGLDRSYLGSIFSKHMGRSLQRYLVGYRMDKACELMFNNSLSIGDISRSVGYDDPLLFSKIFKKYRGRSPKEYRKELNKNEKEANLYLTDR